MKALSPPSRPPRIGDKLLTLTHRGAYVVTGTLKIRVPNDSQPPSELSDSDDTPDEDQSIPSGRRGDDDDVDEGTPAAGGGNNDDDDDDGDQDMPDVGGGNDDGNGDKGKNIQDEIFEEEEECDGEETETNVEQTQASTETGKKKRDHKHAVRILRRQASCSVTKTWDLDLECEEVK
ncbi:hypothetical protein C5167_020484 [Papaver somniferum]|uniref:Uncharacterized protein n=1 Tax=Papaver somniferum TaxID=3469 RepID=A0A4Y7IXC0_PAPSO|nr:hypothetical protein C5167_020484 [Papaver somniferum]